MPCRREKWRRVTRLLDLPRLSGKLDPIRPEWQTVVVTTVDLTICIIGLSGKSVDCKTRVTDVGATLRIGRSIQPRCERSGTASTAARRPTFAGSLPAAPAAVRAPDEGDRRAPDRSGTAHAPEKIRAARIDDASTRPLAPWWGSCLGHISWQRRSTPPTIPK